MKRAETGTIVPDEDSGGTTGGCVPNQAVGQLSFDYKGPLKLQVCSQAQLDSFAEKWLADSATASTQKAWESANAACAACVLTDDDADKFGPLVKRSNPAGGLSLNVGAAVEVVSGGSAACGKAAMQAYECVVYACSTTEECANATRTRRPCGRARDRECPDSRRRSSRRSPRRAR